MGGSSSASWDDQDRGKLAFCAQNIKQPRECYIPSAIQGLALTGELNECQVGIFNQQIVSGQHIFLGLRCPENF